MAKLLANQDKQRSELERAHIEREKARDKHEKLLKEVDRLRLQQSSVSPGEPVRASASSSSMMSISAGERQEIDRLRDRLEKALQSRDATELEAGRLAKELEKAQMHLAKQQENTESTRIEFERMGAELGRLHDRLEKSESEKETLRSSATRGGNPQIEKHVQKLESDIKQLAMEREQLVLQLEKSQEILMNFQKELQNAETELQKTREENRKLRNGQPVAPAAPAEIQAMQKEIQALQQKLLESEKALAAVGTQQQQQQQAAAGASREEIEQWRKVIEQEKNRADMADKAAQEMHKRIQVRKNATLTITSKLRATLEVGEKVW